MTQQEAFKKAFELFKIGPVVGFGIVGKATKACFHVGQRVEGEWKKLGTGESFEEAFANIKAVK